MNSSTPSELPFIDEHCVEVDASPEATWAALEKLPDGFAGPGTRLFTRIVGCTDLKASGPRPLVPGSTFPGFHVIAASHPSALMLEGRHRFSRYALNFRIEGSAPGRSRLCAETRAVFPHLRGNVYKTLVIRTRFHTLAVRNILQAVKERAER